MNEYDSAGWRTCCRESGGYEPTDDPAAVRPAAAQQCSVREKAQEKVFSLLGQWRLLKLERPGVIIGVGGCVASQKARHHHACAVRRPGVRPADPAPADRR